MSLADPSSPAPLRHRLHDALPARRTWLKALHGMMIPLFVWFMLVQPRDVVPLGPVAFQFHSILGLIFVTGAVLWSADYLRRGLAGRPGPKLSPRLRSFHGLLHKTLIWGMAFVAISGFLLGLTSHVLLKAGGVLPIAPPLGLPLPNKIIGWLHTYQFYALGVVAMVHAGFHTWRHVRLRDNALRIMAPKGLHRFL
ncbi:cytochrome b561 [Roseivivax lentus]|uniref:Cytochrome b561 n=1 Tax=Roseivivax lentus TaxID=633194 RepID=A0A1N7M880_9RHOB|nr:cytochrome b/b6 domain-containing protein [Roseivivax lentus]SIS82315.1 cytochrome b561 [Roseivivax lentus]